MDTALGAALATLIASTPNIVVAVWVIIQQNKRIDELLASQKWVLEQLMQLHPPQDVDSPIAPGAPGASVEVKNADQHD